MNAKDFLPEALITFIVVGGGYGIVKMISADNLRHERLVTAIENDLVTVGRYAYACAKSGKTEDECTAILRQSVRCNTTHQSDEICKSK